MRPPLFVQKSLSRFFDRDNQLFPFPFLNLAPLELNFPPLNYEL
jgi:hypothetical protein